MTERLFAPPKPKVYTTEEVAAMAGVSRAAVLQYIVRWPKLAPKKIDGKRYGWTEEDAQKYLNFRRKRGRRFKNDEV